MSSDLFDTNLYDEGPDHEFEPYDANPTICRHCGAVRPMPCYRIGNRDADAAAPGGES